MTFPGPDPDQWRILVCVHLPLLLAAFALVAPRFR